MSDSTAVSDEHRIAANRELWDSRVAGHMASPFYDVPAFLAGACTLMPAELEALGNVEGQTLLHLQCHFGLDTLSWARRGAKVTGMDFSGEAIAQARSLATQAGLEATFIEASVYDLPQHLTGQFDIVFTSYGALTWLPDLKRWADVVCHFLKPGGKLCIAEVHPQWYGLNWETYQLEYPYFSAGTAFEEVASTSYAGAEQRPGLKEYFWCHGISDILQPLLDRGLILQQFREFPYCYYNCFPNLKEIRPGQFIPAGLTEGKVAMMFMLLAVRRV